MAPKKARNIRKIENVHIRVSTEQKEAFAAAAQRSGLSVSSWLLVAALKALKEQKKDEDDLL